MIIPLSTLHHLRISRGKKIALTFLFGLGTFAIIASIVRGVITITNPTSVSALCIWSSLEITVSFIVANGPSLRPFLLRGPCGSNYDSEDEPRGPAGTNPISRGGTSGLGSFDGIALNTSTVVTAGGENGVEKGPPPSSEAWNRESQISVVRTVQVSTSLDHADDVEDFESIKTDLSTTASNSSTHSE